MVSGGFDRSLTSWNVETGKILQTITGIYPVRNSIGFSPDGKLLMFANERNQLNFTETATGRVVKAINTSGVVISAAFSPDGKKIVTASNTMLTIPANKEIPYTVETWDFSSGRQIQSINASYFYSFDFFPISFSPNSQDIVFGYVSATNDSTITVFSSKSGKINSVLSSESKTITDIAVSKNKQLFAVGLRNGAIKMWNLSNGGDFKNLEGFSGAVGQLAFSSGGKFLAGVGNDPIVKIWDTATGKLNQTLSGHSGFVTSVTFSEDEGFLATTGIQDRAIRIWNVKTGEQVQVISQAEIPMSVEFSPDGKKIVCGGYFGVKLFDISTGSELKSLHNISPFIAGDRYMYNFSDVGFSSDGKKIVGLLRILPSGNALRSDEDFEKYKDVIKVWDSASGKEILTFIPHSSGTTSVSFSPNGQTILTSGQDQKVKLWSAANGSEIRTLEGHQGIVTEATFSNNGENIFSCGADGTLRNWDTITGKLIFSLFPTSNDDWLIITPEGFFDGSPRGWKQLIWRFNNNTFDYGAVELYFNEFFYPNLLQDVLAGKSPQPKAGQELEKIDRRQPKVEIASINGQNKAETISTDKRTANVVVEVTDNTSEKKQPAHNATSGAQDLRLFRNGSLVKRWNGDVFEKASGCEKVQTKANEPRRVRCSFETAITAGANNFTAYAFNSANVKSNDDAASIEGKFPKKDGTLYILAIGVNKYANSNYNLNFAVPDVVEIGKAIEAGQNKLRADANLKQYAETRIITLKDETATKDNILLALDRFTKSGAANTLPEKLCANLSELLCLQLKAEFAKIKPTEPEDALVIYFAGHGTSREQRFYLIPHNFTGEGEESLIKQSVSDTELNDYLEKVDAGKLLMVIDACQSGQALGGNAEGRAPMNSKGLAQLAYDKGMLILTATQSQQAALEAVRIGDKKIEHGLLTYALLEALSNKEADKDNNQQIWEREWFDFAVGQVPILQREAMTQRSIDLKNGVERSDVFYVGGDKANDPNNRGLQTPRVFYRREAETNPFILAKP